MFKVLKFLAVALLLILPAVSKADSISENFNSLTPKLAIGTGGNVGAFTVTSGNVDLVGGALYGYLCAAPASGNCVDMNGSTEGQISSANLTLTPGVYDLSFDLLGSQRGYTSSTTVTLGSLFDQTFVLTSGDLTDGIVNTTFTVTSTTVVPLIFTSNVITSGSGYNGALLDNVSLTPATVATPEPASLTLLGFGLFGLFAARRRAASR